MNDFTSKLFSAGVNAIRRYYKILVRETSRKQLVGSTNEWVLDNYYMISEQEKQLREELKDKGLRRLTPSQKLRVREMLYGYLTGTNFAIDMQELSSYIDSYQRQRSLFFCFKEVELIHIALRIIVIDEIGRLCRQLEKKLPHAATIETTRSGDFKTALDDQVADNMRMMNLFTSLKTMSRLKMEEAYKLWSHTEHVLRNEKADIYDQMHDNNKADYRAMLMRQAKKHRIDEYHYAVDLVDHADREGKHVGWLLFPPKKYKQRSVWYVTIVLGFTALLAGVLGWLLKSWWAVALMIIPVMQFVIELFNNLLQRLHKPVATFKLKLEDGIPQEYATMVIMPTIVKKADKVKQMMDKLEVYFLSNRSDNLYFTLLGDASTEDTEDMPFDDEVARTGVERARFLNEKYGREIFFFVYRRRKWSDGEQKWLGMERKRGAILDYNDLLLGNLSDEQKKTYFHVETISSWKGGKTPAGAENNYLAALQNSNATDAKGDVSTLDNKGRAIATSDHPEIKYVITLDTDTQLVLYSAFTLIGAMAHPLNRAVMSDEDNSKKTHATRYPRVVQGYGLMQPRVASDVAVTNKSRYAQLFSGLGGLDVYTTASFELYQDIFGEGSFCGKGIYDLKVFQTVLKGRLPRNLILSHDLLEGCHVRCGLINDVEVYDDNPSNYLDDCKRHHRWTRGDWQIIGWLKHKVKNEKGESIPNVVDTIGRWKIFDNLRRSVMALSLLLLIFGGYIISAVQQPDTPDNIPLWYLLTAAVVIVTPLVFFIFGKITKIHRFFNRRFRYYSKLLHGMLVVIARAIVQLAVLPKEAWMYSDAIVRALYRMKISHRNLLNWVTSEEAERSTRRSLWAYCLQFWMNFVCAVLLLALVWMPGIALAARIGAVVVAAVWVTAPLMMFLLGRPFPSRQRLDYKEQQEVKDWAQRTWHFFDSYISEDNNYLIPDNYQHNRSEKTDYKTSPTNIGYSLLAIVCAQRLGYIDTEQAIERLDHVIDSVNRLPKWNGHLYNWYDIHKMKALYPYFVSTCDSGNFVASLYVVKGFIAELPHNELNGEVGNLLQKVIRLIDASDFKVFYNHKLDVFSIGYDKQQEHLLPYHYNNFASEARLTSYMAICKGDAPYKHWFCLDKTLLRYKRYKGVASWYGTLFEYFMPLIFLKTYRHTLMDETYSFAVMAQRDFINQIDHHLPWGISETAYNELDDSQNYKYHAFGVPYLKFQNTTPDRIVISPYSSLLAISVNDRAVYDNMHKFIKLGCYEEYGFYESYDENNHNNVEAHFAHHQGMILASLTNYLCNDIIQQYFHKSSQMQSMEALLKEKVQLQPYIDMQVSNYKRYTYNRTVQESDIREFETLSPVPEIGILSNGSFTVLLNDRGGGFARYKDIYVNRSRQISSQYYGNFMYIRNTDTDKVWSNTYAPTEVKADNYRVVFAGDRVKYVREDNGIVTNTEITVSSDHNAELRTYTFENHTNRTVTLELTTYCEIIMCRKQDDIAHRVFNGMTIQSEYDPQSQALIFSKKARGDRAKEYFVVNKLFFQHENNLKMEYETSRLRFMGRGGNGASPDVIRLNGNLTNTVGTTLDPIMSFRRQVQLRPGQSETAYQITGFGKSREQVMTMLSTYNTPLAIREAYDRATVFNNMRITLSPLTTRQMTLYNNISKYVLQTASLGLERRGYMVENTLCKRNLWRYGISGDLPILLLEVDRVEQFTMVQEMLQAYEYYKSHGIFIDLVILNDESDRHHETLRRAIDEYENQLRSRRYFDNPLGNIYILNGTDVDKAERNLLYTVARLWFSTAAGLSLDEQLQRMEKIYAKYQDKEHYNYLHHVLTPNDPQGNQIGDGLLYYNHFGGFTKDGKEYEVTRTLTPMPWINVLTNPRFGCIVSSSMGGFTYAHNAQQFKITSWHNDMVTDPASEMLLINHRQVIPTTVRHGFGYSVFEGEYIVEGEPLSNVMEVHRQTLQLVNIQSGTVYTPPTIKAYDRTKGYYDTDGTRKVVNMKVTVFVAREDMTKFYLVDMFNPENHSQKLHCEMVNQMVLGVNEEDCCRYLISDFDKKDNALYIRNSYGELYRDEHAYITSTEPVVAVDTVSPNRKTIKIDVTLPPHCHRQWAFILGVKKQDVALHRWNVNTIMDELQAVRNDWSRRLGTIQVHTPSKTFDLMLNGWYLYQTFSARLFGRVGFYQVGGAIGFRDQLQDVMSVLYSEPAYARHQILLHAAHQFPEGDALHWWHDDLMFGSRTTSSDDYLWLVFVTYRYVIVTGDTDILQEQVPFVYGDALLPSEAERGMNYTLRPADLPEGQEPPTATLFHHLQLCIDKSLKQRGMHGLPLMGCGDWNDGMNHVGVEGKGESVWVGFFLVELLKRMEYLSLATDNTEYARKCHEAITPLQDTLQHNAWDGAWYLRAYFDNGDTLGSRNNTECQIDLISQAWSLLTDTATPTQKTSILRETERRLVDHENNLIRLLTPAFKNSVDDPGYIMTYMEGLRENGGQYTHAAMWWVLALLHEHQDDRAYAYYRMINPITRSATISEALRYKVEPYCICADIYSSRQHGGRGGWTWYTGSASWAYKVGLEGILGFQKRGNCLVLEPHIPAHWDRYTIAYRYGTSLYNITVERKKAEKSAGMETPDAANKTAAANEIKLVDDGQQHDVVVKF